MSSTHDGGKPLLRELKYEPPVGPLGLHEGLSSGINHGNDPQKASESTAEQAGSPGNHGTNHGCGGSQGRY